MCKVVKGNFGNQTEYNTSPIDQAGRYKDHGFKIYILLIQTGH